MTEDDAFDEESGPIRWVPILVVLVAIAGFVTLAWYAYRAGTQSLRDEDLLLIEADKAPMKEAPEDPGGMKFPHQDKTIYEAFSTEPVQRPKVERVLPGPEEPMEKPAATFSGETKTWVNEKLQPESPPEKTVSVMDPPPEPAPAPTEKTEAPQPAQTEPVKEKPAASASVPEASSTPASAPKVAEAKKEEAEKAAKPAPAPSSVPSTGAGARIQLGSYGSEKEAAANWEKMKRKHGSLLSGASHRVVRADLGAKGVFYRLQAGPLESPAAAKELCAKLTVQGQACILASGK